MANNTKLDEVNISLKLASKLRKQGQLDQAIVTCEAALKLQSNNLSIYRILAISHAQKGEIQAAIATYKKAFDLHPEKARNFRQSVANLLQQHQQIYLHIWNTINQTNLDIFEQANLCYPTNIYQGAVEKYFTQTSNDKVIDLNSLTPADRLFLENQEISLEKLKLIINDNAQQQEKYLQSFNCNSKILPSNLKPNRKQTINNLFVFQETMVETGYIYLVCPISGRILRSNQSFLLGGQIAIYRFVGEQVFYLITFGPGFRKFLIYFPKIELILKLATGGPKPTELVNKWKSLAVTYWQEVIANITYKGKREIVLTYGWMGSTAHNLLNELPGIQRLSDTGRLEKVDKILVGPFEYYGQLEIIFPEIPADKIIRVSDADLMNIPKLVLDKHYFALKAGEKFITEDLANRVYQVAVQNCTPSFLSKVEATKKHFPLVLITIRSSNRRVWVSQVEGIANIIEKLTVNFPNLGVIFDGISRIDRNESSLNAKDEERLNNDITVVNQILYLLSDTKVSVYNTIGCTMSESLIWARAIDFYIVPFGGGMAKVMYIANKPGIVHTNHRVLASYKDNWYSASQRENGVAPTYVPGDYIVDINESGVDPMANSYDCNWEGIYNEVIKIIPCLRDY